MSEGSLDPLGLQNPAERLADLLLPGFTVRIERARCLTLATLAVELGNLAVDTNENPMPMILAFERLCVYALAREANQTTNQSVRGFPGRLKAWRAVQAKIPFTPDRYVKGPATNGLVGTYARLARASGLFNDTPVVQSRGDELMREWGRDTGQWDETGDRSSFQDKMRKAMQAEFKFHWNGYEILSTSCRLDQIRARERKILKQTIMDERIGMQSYTLNRLLMSDCRHSYAPPRSSEETDLVDSRRRGEIESAVIQGMTHIPAHCEFGEELAALARAVIIYERIASRLTTAFDIIRFVGATPRRIHLNQILNKPKYKRLLDCCATELKIAARQLGHQVGELTNMPIRVLNSNPGVWEWGKSVEPILEIITPELDAEHLLQRTIVRHHEVQGEKRKPTWLIQDGIGAYRVVPDYALNEEPAIAKSFLFAYRLLNAYSVLEDLKMLE